MRYFVSYECAHLYFVIVEYKFHKFMRIEIAFGGDIYIFEPTGRLYDFLSAIICSDI